MSSKKLRVACMHGYGTNAKFLQRQMRSFKRALDKQIQFVFLEGTYEAPPAFVLDEKVLSLIEGQTRCWNPFHSYKYNQAKYSQDVIAPLEKYFKDESYDGIIGFSQGAVVTHFMTRLCHSGKIDWKGIKSLKFCILVCGNHWSWTEIGVNTDSPIDLPSIHLISESDFLYRNSIFTTTQFKDPLIIHHAFGHSFPRLGSLEIGQIRKFIKKACKKEKTGQVDMSESRL